MSQVQLQETGLAHVGIQTDVLLSMAQKVLTDERPDLLSEKGRTVLVGLTWVNDRKIAKLNAQYRHKDQPTDVLSFSYLDEGIEPSPELLIGDIIISLDTLKRQAKDHGHSVQAEAEILFVHGLLHVLGYDHELGPQQLKDMLARERRYLGDNAGLIERAGREPLKSSS